MADPQQEKINTVDETGKITVTRQIAHEKGLLHATVNLMITNSKGEWLLVKQSADRQDAGQWVNPVGGHVEAGETIEQAMRREVEEEAGLKGELNYKFIGRAVYNRTVIGRIENHLFNVFEILTDEKLVLNEEAVDYKTFTPDQLKRELKTNPKKFGGALFFVIENFYPSLLQ